MKQLAALAALIGAGSVILSATAGVTQTAGERSTRLDSTAVARVRAYVAPSVVHLNLRWTGYVWDKVRKEYVDGGLPFEADTQCTAFVVNPRGYLATAGECVDPMGPVYRSIAEQAARHQIAADAYGNGVTAADVAPGLRVEGYRTTSQGPDRDLTAAWSVPAGSLRPGRSYPARVVEHRPAGRGKAALLRVEATGLPAVRLADAPLDDGARVVSVGCSAVSRAAGGPACPSLMQATIRSSSTGRRPQPGPGYAITVNPRRAMVGGPIVGTRAGVTGFVSSGTGQSGPGGPVLSSGAGPSGPGGPVLVRPAAAVTALMERLGLANRLTEPGKDYRAGLDAYFAGDKEEAVGRLRAVVAAEPRNALAARYLRQARALEEPAPPGATDSSGEDGFPALPVALGSGVLVAVVIGAVLRARRH